MRESGSLPFESIPNLRLYFRRSWTILLRKANLEVEYDYFADKDIFKRSGRK